MSSGRRAYGRPFVGGPAVGGFFIGCCNIISRDKLLAAGVDPLGLTTAQTVQFLAREKATYSQIAKARAIRADD